MQLTQSQSLFDRGLLQKTIFKDFPIYWNNKLIKNLVLFHDRQFDAVQQGNAEVSLIALHLNASSFVLFAVDSLTVLTEEPK